jgi:hypothetical protein
MPGIYGFTTAELEGYKRERKELINFILYDTCTAINTSALSTTLFQTPIGGSGNGITGKTALHTNMTNPGVLANDEQMRIFGYGGWLTPTLKIGATVAATTDNLEKFLNGYIRIMLGPKTYRYAPLALMCNSRGNFTDTTATTSINIAETPFAEKTGFMRLAMPVHMFPRDQFKVEINWAAANLSTNVWYYTFAFIGVIIRNIQ